MKRNKTTPYLIAAIAAGVLIQALTTWNLRQSAGDQIEARGPATHQPPPLQVPPPSTTGEAFNQTPEAALNIEESWVPISSATLPKDKTPVFTALSLERVYLFSLSLEKMRVHLRKAPPSISAGRPVALDFDPVLIPLPMPDGTLQRFTIEETATMEPALAAKYPEIRTYSGKGVDDPAATVQIDLTPRGFHAQVRSPSKGVWLIDPYYDPATDVYLSHFKNDHARGARHAFVCEGLPEEMLDSPTAASAGSIAETPGLPALTGETLRTFRLAIAATGEYTAAVGGGTVPGGLAAVVTAINRVNGIYEQELAIRFVIVANNDLLIFTDAATDGYTDDSAAIIIGENQTKVDAIIGNANYDIGHVFSTGGGGRSGAIGNVCQNGLKAMCVTGRANPLGDAFYVDYVCHEIGHQFGANHTFNGSAGSCSGGSWTANTACEPGSGTTIMGYAGICDINNVQSNSDPYFHAVSMLQIKNYVVTGAGTCGAQSATGNAPPVANAGADFTIPAGTPFVLTGSATDADSDALTYSWEQIDLGPQAALTDPDNGSSPLFRVYPPVSSPARTFPKLSTLLSGATSNDEKLPSISRVLNFRLSARDNRSGGGGVDTDDMMATVVNTGAAFAVTEPAAGANWTGPGTATVTWNVAGTSGNGINTANVNILLSTDGGLTFPLTLASGVPNNGSASVNIPATEAAQARVKVEGADNIFFAISPGDFSIAARPTVAIISPIHNSSIKGSPVLSGTAMANGASPIAGNVVNVNLYHFGTSQYWNGSGWDDDAATLSIQVNPSTHLWTWTGDVPNAADHTLREGLYSMTASTRDDADLTSSPLPGINNIFFTVDTTPPTGSISSPGNGAIIDTSSYTFAGLAEDDREMDRVILFIWRESDELYWNGSAWVSDAQEANLSSTLSGETWTSNFTLPQPGPNLPNGNYRFTALIDDMAGNRIQRDSVVTVDYHQVYHWTAGSYSDGILHNENMYWENPANWSPNGVPGSDDIVNLNIDHVVRSAAPRTVYGFNMSTGGLDFDNAGHSLTIGESGVWSGGALEDIVNILPGVIFTLSGNTQKRIGAGGVVNNQGTVMWTAGTLNGYQDSTFNNKSGGSFIMSADGDVFSNYSGGNIFNNEADATFVKTVGAADSSSYIDEWVFNNNGSIDILQGTVHFNHTLNLNTGSTLSGAGRILLDGTTNLNTALISTGHPELIGALNANSASFSGSNPFMWSNGVINGDFTLTAGSVINLVSGNQKRIGGEGTFTNFGRVNWLMGTFDGYQNSTFNNEEDAVFDVTADGDLFSQYSSGNVFNNKVGALFIKSGNSAVPDGESLVDEWTFNNDGTIRSDIGILRFNTVLNLNGGGSISRNGTSSAKVRSTQHFTLTGTTSIINITFEAGSDWHGNTDPDTAGNGMIATSGGGVFDWTSGTVHNTVNIAAGSTFTLTGADLKQIGGGAVLNNYGNASWSGTGDFQGYQNSTFYNHPDATFSSTSDADFVNYSSGNEFVNMAGAIFQKTAGMENNRCDWAFNNHGTVLVSSGALASNNGGTSSGTFAPTGTGYVQFTGGTHSLITTAKIQGTGKTQILGGVVIAVNPVNAASTATTLDIAGGTLTSAVAGSFTAIGTVNWTGGEIGGTFNVKAGSQIHLTTGEIKQIATGGVIRNSGAATWEGPGLLRGYQNSTWINEPGSSFTVLTDGDVFGNYSSGNVFHNELGASFVKSTGAVENSSYIDEWTFNNNGTVQSQQGTLHFNTILNLNVGSTLAGAGRILLDGTTNLNTSLSSAGNPELVGTLNATEASFSGSNPFVWSSGEINGAFTLVAGSVMDLISGNIKQIGGGGVITNFGRINWRLGLLRGYQNATLNNESGAVFDATADGDVFGNYSSGNVFNNKAGALFIKSGTTGGSTFVDEWTFNNSSSIRSDAGLLHFNTALDLRDGGSISRNGNVSARILSSYDLVLTGTTTVSNVTFETAGDWHGNTAEETTGNGTIATQSDGIFEWTGGTAHNTVNIATGSTFSISGNSLKQISGVLNNRGIATRTGNGELRGYQNSSFVNHAGAVFNVQTNAPFTNYSSGNRLFNSGVLNIGSPIGVSPLHWGFTQTGTGRLNVDIGGPVAATPDFDQFNISGDAVLAGSVGVTLVNAYAPLVNTEFPILTFGSRSGSFSSVSGIGSFWSLKYEADRVSVVSRNLRTNFTDWANYFFEDSLPVENLISGDPDHDGLTNLAEYAFGLNPHAADAAPTTGGILPVSGSQYLTLTYNRPAGSAALTDITYMGERSSSMAASTWFASGVITHSVTLLPGGEEERVVIRSTEPIDSATNDFLHLKVIKSD